MKTLRPLLMVVTLLTGVAAASLLSPSAQAETTRAPSFLLAGGHGASGGCAETRGGTAYVFWGTCSQADVRQRMSLVANPHGDLWIVGGGWDFGLCLGIEGGSTSSGARVVASPCGAVPAQRWTVAMANLTEVRFRNTVTGRCLVWTEGGNATQGSCTADPAVFVVPTGSNIRLRPTHSGKCLDVNNSVDGGLNHGAKVQQWECLGVGQTNQLWRLNLIHPPYQYRGCATYYSCGETFRAGVTWIHAKHSDLCLSGAGSSTNGNKVAQAICTTSENHGYHFAPVALSPARMTFQLRPSSLGYNDCLDIDISASGDGTANGLRAQIWDCLGTGQANQIWTVEVVA